MATAGTSTLSDSTKETLRVLRQGAGNRKAIEARLFQLRVTELKQVCKEFNIKISGGSKATLCGKIVSYWQTGLLQPQSACTPVAHLLLLPVQCLHQQLASIYSNSGHCPATAASGKKRSVTTQRLHFYGSFYLPGREQG